ncbi:GTPase family protein [Leptothoe spongobia]|uniref:50S ribosome-binding GTPase n=1 Tax=Leptothoe spongobia TAU-MAC 1115 TaxID=1967444 RepID=A0A947DIZ5_9CYAN|nr:GTPase [Leptothoe spongobia]MBT9317494.1 50S ribosome-binding GTPase [Leptothoe spongobia TAU-MAC 1115]
MVQLKRWQWIVLALPLVLVVIFVMIAAGFQLRTWGITWVWGVILLVFVGWRWLLVHWTKPREIEQIVTAVKAELTSVTASGDDNQTLEASLQPILTAAREDAPVWDDWVAFWQRCQSIVATVAHHYHPDVKYPLLNIYVTQAYGLIRGTVDDMDRAMTQLAPVLNQVTVGQAYEAYEIYRKLEPSMGKLWRAWNWAQWLLNPAAAAAKVASQKSSTQANQQLLVNLSQLLRETALRNLAQQTAMLYGGDTLPAIFDAEKSNALETGAKTATLQSILETATPAKTVEQKPVSLMLVGRTGAGKSSLINTLFKTDLAEVDVLPSTDKLRQYSWQLDTGEVLNLIDSPGYEQISRGDFRDLVLEQAANADLLVLATPALDPALQIDKTFLHDLKAAEQYPPTVVALTQVDRLRPVREWQPPYDWQAGERSKEASIRDAVAYRIETLGEVTVVPLVTYDSDRTAWNDETLALKLVETLGNAKQYRLARFLTNQTALAAAAAKLIDQYTFQMTTTQGVTELLKSPILRYISRMMTGSDLLATALMEKIPVEHAPVVIGKLQLAYELFNLLAKEESSFDLAVLWPTLLDNDAPPEQNAWAFGHALTAYWLGETNRLDRAFDRYLQEYGQADASIA